MCRSKPIPLTPRSSGTPILAIQGWLGGRLAGTEGPQHDTSSRTTGGSTGRCISGSEPILANQGTDQTSFYPAIAGTAPVIDFPTTSSPRPLIHLSCISCIAPPSPTSSLLQRPARQHTAIMSSKSLVPTEAVVGTTIAFSFILLGIRHQCPSRHNCRINQLITSLILQEMQSPSP